MRGWIVNLHRSEQTREVERAQTPCFYLPDGDAVFEVWIYHHLLQRWFVMSTASDPTMVAQGVVYFWPGDIAGLKRTMYALEDQAGVRRRRP